MNILQKVQRNKKEHESQSQYLPPFWFESAK